MVSPVRQVCTRLAIACLIALDGMYMYVSIFICTFSEWPVGVDEHLCITLYLLAKTLIRREDARGAP